MSDTDNNFWGFSIQINDEEYTFPALRDSDVFLVDGVACVVREEFVQCDDHSERTLWLICPPEAARARVQGATLRWRVTDGAARISVPMARLRPAAPAAALFSRPREFSAHDQAVNGHLPVTITAPDCLSGTVAIAADDGLLAVTPAPLECAVQVHLYGEGQTLIIAQEFLREQWVQPGATLLLARQIMQRLPPDGLAGVGAYLAQTFTPPADRPAWAQHMTIWEVEPGFHGGWTGLTAQLDAITGWGFNTLYLMPWHQDSYGTVDYLSMDPTLGDFAGLRALCDAAHARGMHVLFDLLVNITDISSPYLTAHPDWYYRAADGAVLQHPTWKSPCLDPAAPGFRAFLTEYAVRCCTEWGADGFRVDAVAYRGGNWHSPSGRQPYEHDHAIFTLLAEIRTALRRTMPDAILMSETFGPLQAAWCDVLCFQWIIWMDWLQQALLDGAIDGATLQRLLADHFAVLPPETWMTTYSHTHDTLAFTGQDYTGPAIDALFAHLALLGAGVMVFGGGWKMPRRPFPAEETAYRALLACKTTLGGVAVGDVAFPAPAHPALCIAERPSTAGLIHVVTNFSTTPCPLSNGELLYTRCGSQGGVLLPFDTVVIRAS